MGVVGRRKEGGGGAAASPRPAPPPPRRALLLLLLLALAATAAPCLAVAATASRPVILLLGDSLTEFSAKDGGWLHDLEAYYGGRRADLANRGFGGFNSRFLAHVADGSLDEFPLLAPGSTGYGGGGDAVAGTRVKAAVVGVGSNDAKVPGTFGTELGVPLEEYKRNLRALVRRLQSRGVQTVIVATPPPAHEARRAAIARERAASKQGPPSGLPDRTTARTRMYAEAARQVARECGNLAVADLFAAFEQANAAGDMKFYEADGLHLSPDGNALVANAVKNALRKTPFAAENLPAQFPWYGDIDPRNPTKAFAAAYGGAMPESSKALVAEVSAPVPVPGGAPPPAPPSSSPSPPSPSPSPSSPAHSPAPPQQQQWQQQQQQQQQRQQAAAKNNGGGGKVPAAPNAPPPRKLGSGGGNNNNNNNNRGLRRSLLLQ